jgi:hypothetical protein
LVSGHCPATTTAATTATTASCNKYEYTSHQNEPHVFPSLLFLLFLLFGQLIRRLNQTHSKQT